MASKLFFVGRGGRRLCSTTLETCLQSSEGCSKSPIPLKVHVRFFGGCTQSPIPAAEENRSDLKEGLRRKPSASYIGA